MAAKAYRFQGVIAFTIRACALTLQQRVYRLARLMSGLPTFFKPIRLADRGEVISGDVAVSQFPRLRGLLRDGSGIVHVTLACAHGTAGGIRIRGSLSTTLKVECQRCLGAFDLPLDLDVEALAVPEASVGTDTDGAADVLMRGEDNGVHLGDFIEDELILAVPLAPLHPASQCPVARYEPAPGSGRANPFAALKSLKSNKD